MINDEKQLVRVTDQIAQAGLRPLTRDNAEVLAVLRDELTDLLEQAAQ